MLPHTVLQQHGPIDFDFLSDFSQKNSNEHPQGGIDLIAKECDESIYIQDKNAFHLSIPTPKNPDFSINSLKKSENKTSTSNNLANTQNLSIKSNKDSIDHEASKISSRPLRKNSEKKARSFSLNLNLNLIKKQLEKKPLFGTCKLMITKGSQKQKVNEDRMGGLQFSSARVLKKGRGSIIPSLVTNISKINKIEPVHQKTGTKQNLLTNKSEQILKFSNRKQKKKASTIMNEEQKNKINLQISNKFQSITNEKTFSRKKQLEIQVGCPVKNLSRNSDKENKESSFVIVQEKMKREDFVFLKVLGKGNFGEVSLVVHKSSGFVCAMKILGKMKMFEEKYVNQIVRQIVIQSYIEHSNAVPLYGVFDDDKNVYILMEYCPDGHLLDKIIKKRRLEEDQTSQIILGISKGIQYLQNERIIHRDIKPQNIMISYGVPKLADFGWSVYQGRQKAMRETTSGSPLYYSPEVVQKQAYNQKIDIWAMGILCYQCLVGQVPFKVYTMLNINRIVEQQYSFPEYIDISENSKDFIKKCLMKKPEQRWSISRLLTHPFLAQLLSVQKH